MTYKRFVGLVHKQIKGSNPNILNTKINAVIGAAWKDYKAEFIEGKEASVSGETSKGTPKAKESTDVKDAIVEVVDISGDKEILKEKSNPERKREKRKRAIVPIRIKLTKPTPRVQVILSQ